MSENSDPRFLDALADYPQDLQRVIVDVLPTLNLAEASLIRLLVVQQGIKDTVTRARRGIKKVTAVVRRIHGQYRDDLDHPVVRDAFRELREQLRQIKKRHRRLRGMQILVNDQTAAVVRDTPMESLSEPARRIVTRIAPAFES